MRVFVLSHSGKPLMPTTPRRARIFLKTRRARVVTCEPFTIQLRFETTTHTQPVTVGVDTGSQTVGIAATANMEVVLQVEHLVPTSRGGSDRASNLVIACDACNKRKGTRTAEEFGYPEIQAQARVPLQDAAHVSSIKTAVVQQLAQQFGSERVAVRYGYETKYQCMQVLHLPKAHAYDAVAIACAIGEVVKPLTMVYQLRCVPRGNYQRYNGKHSEHKVWAPSKVKGWKLYELVEARGQIGYIGGRRLTGAFVVKDVRSGKALAEVTPRKLVRLARCVHGWIITRFPFSHITGKEGGASSPS